MGKLGRRRNTRWLWLMVGVVAMAGVAASFGTPKVGCAMSPDDDDDDPASPDDPGASTSMSADVQAGAALTAIDPSTFCLTAGRTSPSSGRMLRVDSAGMRGVIAGDKSSAGALTFVVHGRSANISPLANGELRQQIGLKLRARDTCNVVYVMWRIAPTPGVAVSVKYNPGKATHTDCGDRGYMNLKPDQRVAVPPLTLGAHHTLEAAIEGVVLRVEADGAEVWRGTLPPEAFAFEGAVGIRSDNVDADFQLRVPGGGNPRARCVNPGTELAH